MASACVEEKEKVYIFLDWANVYREGRNLHWEKYCPYFERFEGCVPTKNIDELTDEQREQYRNQLEKIKKKKAKQKIVYLSKYFIEAEHLKSICSRCEVKGEEPPKERCFAFVSHPPGVSIAHHPTLMLLDQFFTIEYHERIEWATDKQKEKGVDVALAIQIMSAIHEEKNSGTNLRIVIISSDSDFAPVVKKVMEPKETEKVVGQKISIEVWGWTSNISESYQTYLEKLEEKFNKRVLYFLDEYMYQISYKHKLEHRWCISIAPAANADEHIREWFTKLSHNTLVKHLQESAGFEQATTDFTIHWKNNRIIISFLTTEGREKFKSFSKEFGESQYFSSLRQKEYDYREWKQEKLAALKKDEIDIPQTHTDNVVVDEEDDGIVFQN